MRIARLAFSALLLLVLGLAAACEGDPVEQCFVVGDEDADGLADCLDPDCWRKNGPCKESCGSSNDEDGDGLVDCDDDDCWTEQSGCEERCDSSSDEDGDGRVGCDDGDCWTLENGCQERCQSGEDEDGDGLVSCEDSDCWTAESGCEERCQGQADEDGDGDVDCADADCLGSLACVPKYEADIKPILVKYCAGESCHQGDVVSVGLDIDDYETMKLPAIYCSGKSKGWCSWFRIVEPSMPPDCLNCLLDSEIAAIKAWVDGDMPP